MKILFIILSFGLFTFSGVADRYTWKTQANGSKEKRHRDGTFEIVKPDGRVSIVHPDRRVTLRDPDGTQTIVHPDGTQTKGTWDKKDSIFYKPSKPIIKPTEKKQTVSGLSSYRRPTGGVIRFPRKSETKHANKESKAKLTQSEMNRIREQIKKGLFPVKALKLKDGRIRREYVDGRFEFRYPDGRIEKVSFRHPGGDTETRYPDGRIEVTDTEGNTTFSTVPPSEWDKNFKTVTKGVKQYENTYFNNPVLFTFHCDSTGEQLK